MGREGRRQPGARLGAGLAGALALLATVALAGCGRSDERALRVFAAASLTDALREAAQAFEGARAGTDVQLAFAGSQVLRLQIEQGAPADVFASADEAHLEALVEAGRVEDARLLAHNALVIVAPRDDPLDIASFEDLGEARRLVIAAPTVPAGRYTERLFERAARRHGEALVQRVRANVASEETNVRLVRAKVELGEADAALVYRTDAAASDRVRAVELADALQVRTDYHVGVVSGSPRRAAANRFVAFLRGAAGQAILRRHGFVLPGSESARATRGALRRRFAR